MRKENYVLNKPRLPGVLIADRRRKKEKKNQLYSYNDIRGTAVKDIVMKENNNLSSENRHCT